MGIVKASLKNQNPLKDLSGTFVPNLTVLIYTKKGNNNFYQGQKSGLTACACARAPARARAPAPAPFTWSAAPEPEIHLYPPVVH